MATKDDRELEAELGPSPWPMYANEEEPWKDHERVLKLNRRFEYQYEIAHVLGTTPSTASYWLQKAEEGFEPEPLPDDLKCDYFEVCGNKDTEELQQEIEELEAASRSSRASSPVGRSAPPPVATHSGGRPSEENSTLADWCPWLLGSDTVPTPDELGRSNLIV